MKKTAFRIIPGRQRGLFRPQVGKRVFWVFWQWHDIKHPPEAEGISEAVISVWNLAASIEHSQRQWKSAVSGSIKP